MPAGSTSLNAGDGSPPQAMTVLPSGWRRTLPSPNDLQAGLVHGPSIGRCHTNVTVWAVASMAYSTARIRPAVVALARLSNIVR